MQINQNNPMQRRMRPECREKQFDSSGKSAAFLQHSEIL